MSTRLVKLLSTTLCLLNLITTVHSESIDETKKLLTKEIEDCDYKLPLIPERRIACQLKVANKISLLYLIEQMKESAKTK